MIGSTTDSSSEGMAVSRNPVRTRAIVELVRVLLFTVGGIYTCSTNKGTLMAMLIIHSTRQPNSTPFTLIL